MLKTVTLGSSVTIQGVFVRQTADGKMVVRVGKDQYAGNPIQAAS